MNSAADEKPGWIARLDRFFERLITGWNPYHPDKLKDRGLDPVHIEESPVRRKGTWLVVIAATAFFIWSVTAPIDQGSVLPGTVTVAGYRKAVQHPGGGVISHVLVSEGAHVEKGQVLVQINPLDSEANVANLEQDYINTLVSESRAKAELLGRPIAWDPELNTLDQRRVAEAKSIQTSLYNNRQAQFREQINGLQAQLAGVTAAIASHHIQLETLNQELSSVQDLSRQGYVPKSQVNTTLRSKAEQDAALEDAQANVGKLRAQIAETKSQFQSDVAKELAELDKNRDSAGPKLRAALFNQSLSEIRAPVSGTIVNLKVFTEGGVIGSGDTLMEVVPDKGTLVVEAKVSPQAIDSVHVGQKADVRFTAFNASRTPVIEGIVRAVGVDKQKARPGEEVRENEDYYLAQVEVTPEALKALDGQPLHPGMPADVLIRKGRRTFMSYLLRPLTDKFARAFRE